MTGGSPLEGPVLPFDAPPDPSGTVELVAGVWLVVVPGDACMADVSGTGSIDGTAAVVVGACTAAFAGGCSTATVGS